MDHVLNFEHVAAAHIGNGGDDGLEEFFYRMLNKVDGL